MDFTYNLSINQGATFKKRFGYYTDALYTVPKWDFTNCTARCHFRLKPADKETGAPLLEATTENGRLVLSPDDSDCYLEFNLSDTDTETLPTKDLVFDVEVEFASGEVIRVLEGVATVRGEVTRTL